MILEIKRAEPSSLRENNVLIAGFAGQTISEERLPAEAAKIVTALKRWDWGEGQVLRRPWRGRADGWLVLIGLGEPAAFDSRRLSLALERIFREASELQVEGAAVVLPTLDWTRGPAGLERCARELALHGYRFERFRTTSAPGEKAVLKRLTIVDESVSGAEAKSALKRARTVADAVSFARDLANTPPNEATPDWMAETSRSLAKKMGMKVQVLGEKELARRQMGGILAVGSGSAHPPRMVRLEWGSGRRSVALVGKGVTFDTGGISIKPASNMDEMKFDKCGACAVLGLAHASASLGTKLRFRAYLPFAENMPDGNSYRPGDIVKCANGKSVEILNTDAEGRMLLADALSWASSEAPDVILDYATLTGACVVALGSTTAGLFTPDDGLAGELLSAAEDTGERLWRLPLDSEAIDEMRGAHADLRNIGGRWGGASNAAGFLSNFVSGSSRWAHFDIAGPAYLGNDQKERKGATGFGIALTTTWLERLATAKK